ncbi:MAG: hypothetical protein R3F62_29940 [Planctomycetota bacterium]
MSRRWQRRLRVFPLTSEFNVPYLRCARGGLLSLDVRVDYASPGEPRRKEPAAYWRARLDAELERVLRHTLAQVGADDVRRRRLQCARAVAAVAAVALAADLVVLEHLELLSPTCRPLGGRRWTRVQGHDRSTVSRGGPPPETDSPGNQAPSHQEV